MEDGFVEVEFVILGLLESKFLVVSGYDENVVCFYHVYYEEFIELLLEWFNIFI